MRLYNNASRCGYIWILFAQLFSPFCLSYIRIHSLLLLDSPNDRALLLFPLLYNIYIRLLLAWMIFRLAARSCRHSGGLNTRGLDYCTCAARSLSHFICLRYTHFIYACASSIRRIFNSLLLFCRRTFMFLTCINSLFRSLCVACISIFRNSRIYMWFLRLWPHQDHERAKIFFFKFKFKLYYFLNFIKKLFIYFDNDDGKL